MASILVVGWVPRNTILKWLCLRNIPTNFRQNWPSSFKGEDFLNLTLVFTLVAILDCIQHEILAKFPISHAVMFAHQVSSIIDRQLSTNRFLTKIAIFIYTWWPSWMANHHTGYNFGRSPH